MRRRPPRSTRIDTLFPYTAVCRSPWYGCAVTLFVAADFMSLGFSAWPDKLPAEVLVVKEQWDKAKAKSTKSAQGRFVWNLGRSAMAAMIAFQLIPVDIDGGFMRLAFKLGREHV